jgi:ribosomal protein S18 acetylase RimI-like enzyme
MAADHPLDAQIPQLRTLWKLAFGDPDWFLDSFFRTAFAPDRCLCICEEDRPVAALYWIDCTLEGGPLAYIYAVATHPEHRKKGLASRLIHQT